MASTPRTRPANRCCPEVSLIVACCFSFPTLHGIFIPSLPPRHPPIAAVEGLSNSLVSANFPLSGQVKRPRQSEPATLRPIRHGSAPWWSTAKNDSGPTSPGSATPQHLRGSAPLAFSARIPTNLCAQTTGRSRLRRSTPGHSGPQLRAGQWGSGVLVRVPLAQATAGVRQVSRAYSPGCQTPPLRVRGRVLGYIEGWAYRRRAGQEQAGFDSVASTNQGTNHCVYSRAGQLWPPSA